MFSKNELEKYARTLWWGLTTARTSPYKPGDFILLRFDQAATPLAEAVYDLLITEGMVPVPRQNLTPGMEVSFYGKGSDEQIKAVPPGDRELMQNLSGLISLIAPASLTHLAGTDPAKIGLAAVTRKFLREIMEGREQTGDFGWTLCAYPTPEQARCAGLSVEEYAAQIKQACFLDADDPAAKWREVHAEVTRVKEALAKLHIDRLKVESANCDLTVTPGAERRWLGVSGHNIPSFEVFLSPDWRGTEGVYYADQPSYRSGNRVEGVRLTFKAGRVVEVSAKEGEDFVKKQLAMDTGAAQLGEFSLTDRRHSRINAFMASTLFDENFGGPFGNCHVAVGASYSDTYAGDQTTLDAAKKEALGFNDSALHWDLVNTEDKTVTALLKGGGSQVIYAGGEFKL
ncbi:MAG TPA: aminopeptidase [Humidesulfovibrio sp.]|uniref:aminopeptidase n=1 Tax=Humidesulfovibrio sp. TaxID=2910988 RepID=UPI002D144222|nr:aminopeptidase [Humidesulfovibrio sp.]HWR04103.1 aminopeptidase [Humidesulfovibrio sp.]